MDMITDTKLWAISLNLVIEVVAADWQIDISISTFNRANKELLGRLMIHV